MPQSTNKKVKIISNMAELTHFIMVCFTSHCIIRSVSEVLNMYLLLVSRDASLYNSLTSLSQYSVNFLLAAVSLVFLLFKN